MTAFHHPVWRKIVEIINVAKAAKPAREKNPATPALRPHLLPPPWWGRPCFLPPPWWGRVGVGGNAEPADCRWHLPTGMRGRPERTPHPWEWFAVRPFRLQ